MTKSLILLTLLSNLAAAPAWALSSKIGQTYTIGEADALEEIEAKARATEFKPDGKKMLSEAIARMALPMPVATQNRTRFFMPVHQSEFDIIDHKGNVIYPKGYSFNPLDYVTLPGRVVVFKPDQSDFIKPLLQRGDRLILTEGNPLDLMAHFDTPVFMLDPPLKARLDVQVVPSIISQSRNAFQIEEMIPLPVGQ